MMSELEPKTWGCCPADVLLTIFSKLDIDTIIQCYSVNHWWRDVVDYWAQHKDQWRCLATHLMPNQGNTFIRKSLLGWRELYYNYRLWHHIDKAELKYDSQMSFEGISYLHIYRDLLTVVHGEEDRDTWSSWTKMTMLKLNEQGFQPAEKIEGPCTNLVQAIINAGPYKRIAFPLKPALDEESYFYTLTEDNIIEFKVWVDGKELDSEAVSTYYGDDDCLDDFELVERGDFSVILFYMKQGLVIFQDCSTHRIGKSMRGSEPFNRPHYSMNAEKIFRPIAPAHLLFDPAHDFPFTRERKQKLKLSDDEDNGSYDDDDESLFESDDDDSMENDHLFPISIPDEAEKLEEECSIVYKSGKRFVGLSLDMAKHPPYCGFSNDDVFRMSSDSDDNNSDESERKAKGAEKEKFIAKCVRWVGRDTNLSCATQHGDMLLLGYHDGKIEIHQINFEVVADTSPAKLVFNIQDYVPKEESGKYTPSCYKVVVIEVYEMQESHCLLIATALKLYRFVVTYPEGVKNLVGTRLEVFSK